VNELTLVVPGLAGMVASGEGTAHGVLAAAMSAGRPLGSPGPVDAPSVLSRILPAQCEYPGLASLSYLADYAVPPAAWCLRADPVGLGVGTAGLFLERLWFPDLPSAEREELAAAAAQVLSPCGLRLETSPAGRWYLLSDAPMGRGLKSPWDAVGENLLESWTEPTLGRDLLVLMNEVQVVLHQHRVNQARRDKNLAPVNCLWPWGGGPTTKPGAPAFSEIWTDGEPMAAGLAAMTGVPCRQADGLAAVLPGSGRSTLCWLSGEGGADACKLALERQWLAPLCDRWLPPSRLVLCGLNGEGMEIGRWQWWSMKRKRRGARTRNWTRYWKRDR
jgi:hypothetical protein